MFVAAAVYMQHTAAAVVRIALSKMLLLLFLTVMH